MNKKIFAIIIILVNIISINFLFSYNYNVDPKFLHKHFWISYINNSNDIILSNEEIVQHNKDTKEKISQVVDLTTYLDNLKEKDVVELISIYKLPEDKKYLADKELDLVYFQKLIKDTDIQNISKKNFNYGFVIKKENLRAFPTLDNVYDKPNDIEFDTIQETAIYSGSPLIILHKSKDKKFLFIKAQNYAGWIDSNSVVVADKLDVVNYINTKDFLVVTANKLMLSFNPYNNNLSNAIFYMGQKFPIISEKPDFVDNQSTVGNYVVKIPSKNKDGNFEFSLALIPYNADVSVGYLEYTQKNIINQAFKIQGERYDWGGHFSARDCSAFIQDIFNTFGINIPRNTGQISNISGEITNLDGLSEQERLQKLERIKTGTLLLMKGHIFLYLGFVDKKHYVISDLASIGGDKATLNELGEIQLERIAVNQVSINTLDVLKTTNISFLNLLTRAIFIGK